MDDHPVLLISSWPDNRILEKKHYVVFLLIRDMLTSLDLSTQYARNGTEGDSARQVATSKQLRL